MSSLATNKKTYTYLNLLDQSVVDMREESSNKSKVNSQFLFFEEIVVEDTTNNYTKIKTPDDYAGWVPTQSLITVSESYRPNLITIRQKAHVYESPDIKYGVMLSLPYGSKLKMIEDLDEKWVKVVFPNNKEGFIQKGEIADLTYIANKKALIQLALKFLDIPYAWGGRSSFGFDCSGFTQFLYAQLGIYLRRNARDQILDARLKVISLDKLEDGDLLFWGKSEEKIEHVALYIGAGKFIHASARENEPWVRINHLSDSAWKGDETYPYFTARSLMG
jgi:SH3-like domain-containing protein